MRKFRVPKKMSTMIKLALNDLRWVESHRRTYRVGMDYAYHAPDAGYGNKCVVCFAGSVMARTGGADPTQEPSIGAWGKQAYRMFRALDNLRLGSTGAAARNLLLSDDKFYKACSLSRAVTSYSQDPKQFKKDMTELRKDLLAVGL